MNMMTRIEAADSGATIRAVIPAGKADRKDYFDEHGNPSTRSGPDLTKAVSVEQMMKSLSHRRTGPNGSYSTAFYHAAKDSGITMLATHEEEGERLWMWLPCDGQEELRRPRYDALAAHLKAKPARRDTVIELMKLIGRFRDNRKFATIEEAARAFVDVGGRIYVLPNGICEEIIPAQIAMADDWRLGYPIRQAASRYDATLRRKGAREEMAAYVRHHGKLHDGSGSYVIQGESE